MLEPTNRHQKRQRCKARRRERKRWPRRCNACGKAWTREAWEARPEVGLQDLGLGRHTVLDLRDCTCRSTMTVRAVWLEQPAEVSHG